MRAALKSQYYSLWLVPSHFSQIKMSNTCVSIVFPNIPYFVPVVNMLQIRLCVASYEVSGLVAAKLSWVDPTTFVAMELDTHLLYLPNFQKISRLLRLRWEKTLPENYFPYYLKTFPSKFCYSMLFPYIFYYLIKFPYFLLVGCYSSVCLYFISGN